MTDVAGDDADAGFGEILLLLSDVGVFVALSRPLLFVFPHGRQPTSFPKPTLDADRWGSSGVLASEDSASEADAERSPTRKFGLLSLSRKVVLPLLPSVLPLAIVGRAVTVLSSMSAAAAPSGRNES